MSDKQHDGYIDPAGEFIRLDDLDAMERSLTLQFDGDINGVLYGLHQAALELAKKQDDVAVRRFLARARDIGGGSVGEAQRVGRLGLAFEEIERYDLAAECYEYGRSVVHCDDGCSYFLHNNYAFCLAMLERFTEAEPLARQAIQIDPHLHNAYKNLGLSLMGQGRFREAAGSFRSANDLCPTDGRSAQYLAIAEERLGREAVQQLN